MSKIIKLIAIIIMFFIVWITLCYFGIAFYKLELNVINWEVENRGTLIGLSLIYVIFSPLFSMGINDEIESNKK